MTASRWSPLVLAAFVSALVAVASCDEPDAPEQPSRGEIEAEIRQLRERVQRASDKSADAIRTHNPDTGLELPQTTPSDAEQ